MDSIEKCIPPGCNARLRKWIASDLRNIQTRIEKLTTTRELEKPWDMLDKEFERDKNNSIHELEKAKRSVKSVKKAIRKLEEMSLRTGFPGLESPRLRNIRLKLDEANGRLRYLEGKRKLWYGNKPTQVNYLYVTFLNHIFEFYKKQYGVKFKDKKENWIKFAVTALTGIRISSATVKKNLYERSEKTYDFPQNPWR